MSEQCVTCGMQTRAGAKFCHGCGTPIGSDPLPQTMPFASGAKQSGSGPQAKTAPPPKPREYAADTVAGQSAYAPQIAQSYHPAQPYSASSKKSSGGLKAILIALAIIIFLGGATIVGSIYFIGKRVSQIATANGQNNPLAGLPDINVSIGEDAESKLGVPVYPGARKSTFSIAVGAGNENGKFAGATAIYSTDDDIDEVVSFYKESLGSEATIKDVSSNGSRSVEFALERPDGEKHVVVSNSGKDGASTQIAIASGSKSTNPKDAGKSGPTSAQIQQQAKQIEEQAKTQAAQALERARQARDQAEQLRRQNIPPPPPAPRAPRP